MDLSLLGQSREAVGAASCRPLRSWPLSRRSGRVPALPYPPPRSPQCTSLDCGWTISFPSVLARRLALAIASFSFRAAQMASARPAILSTGVTLGDRAVQVAFLPFG